MYFVGIENDIFNTESSTICLDNIYERLGLLMAAASYTVGLDVYMYTSSASLAHTDIVV